MQNEMERMRDKYMTEMRELREQLLLQQARVSNTAASTAASLNNSALLSFPLPLFSIRFQSLNSVRHSHDPHEDCTVNSELSSYSCSPFGCA